MKLICGYRGMEITTNIGCLNDCVYCPQGLLINEYKKRSASKYMTYKVFKTCVDKLPEDVNIHFSGMSEPWLNPNATLMLIYAYKKKHRIVIATTLVGMGVTDAFIVRAVPCLRFMLHLPSGEGLEKIPVTKRYLEVLDIIKKRKDIKYFMHGEKLHPAVREVLGFDIEKKKLCSRAGNVRGVQAPANRKRKHTIFCKRGCFQNVLLPNGDVALCCMDYKLKHILGNLLELKNYDDLFKSGEFQKIKKGLKDNSVDILCRTCENAWFGEWLDEWM